MKKVVFLLVVFLLFFSSCHKDPESFDKNLLKGKWILEQKNGELVSTNDMLVMEFENRKHSSSAIYPHPYGGVLWATSDRYSYHFDDEECLIIEGKNAEKKDVYFKASIESLSANVLSYIVLESKINDILLEEETGKMYSFVKTERDMDLIGTWEITDGNGRKHKREFFEDGTFHIINVGIDKKGEYSLHGDFLAMNYAETSIISGDIIYVCDCFLFTSVEDKIIMVDQYLANGEMNVLTMTRVTQP